MSKLLCIAVLVAAAVFGAVAGDCECRENNNGRQPSMTCADCEEFPLDQISADVELLHLPSNRLSRIPALTNLTKLIFIDLSSNSINTIVDGAFAECVNLQTLNLTSNRLGNLTSKMFEGMGELLHLMLGFNDLEKLDEQDLFREHSKKLEVLNITSNHISTLGHNTLTDMPELKVLDLSGNMIAWHHPLHFAGLNKLEFLHLNDNQLVNLSANIFSDLDSIQMVDLSRNQIVEIENMAFQGLDRSLQTLHLSNNKITVIHEEFRMMTSLRDLFLNSNPIIEFRPNVLPQSIKNFNIGES